MLLKTQTQTNLPTLVVVDLPNVTNFDEALSPSHLRLILEGCREIATERSNRVAHKMVFCDFAHYQSIWPELSEMCYEMGYLLVHCLRLRNPDKETVDGRILEFVISQSWFADKPWMLLIHAVDRDYVLAFPSLTDRGCRVEVINPARFPSGSQAGRAAAAQHVIGIYSETVTRHLRDLLEAFTKKHLEVFRSRFSPFIGEPLRPNTHNTTKLLVLVIAFALNEKEQGREEVQANDLVNHIKAETATFGLSSYEERHCFWTLHGLINSGVFTNRTTPAQLEIHLNYLRINSEHLLSRLVKAGWMESSRSLIGVTEKTPVTPPEEAILTLPESYADRVAVIRKVLQAFLKDVPAEDERRSGSKIIDHLATRFSLTEADAHRLFDQTHSPKKGFSHLLTPGTGSKRNRWSLCEEPPRSHTAASNGTSNGVYTNGRS